MKKYIFLSVYFLCVLRLAAVSPAPYTEVLSFSSRIFGTGSSTMSVYAENTVAVSDSVSNGDHESSIGDVSLRPNKTYSVNFTGNGPNEYRLSFIAPSGYTVFIDGIPTDLYGVSNLSGSYSHDYRIELRPSADYGRGVAGEFSGVEIGKSITWSVGLGGLRAGQSAGRIYFKEFDLTNNPASRDRLYYSAPLNIGQIFPVFDSPNVLRQLRTAQTIVDLQDISNGYIMYFHSSDPAYYSWNGTLYTFSDSPWKTIKVESLIANQLNITETEGSGADTVNRVSSLALRGAGQIASGQYVLELQEGDGSTVLRTTTHTSTVPTDGQRDDMVTVRSGGPAGTPVATSKYHYVRQSWGGEELAQSVADPDGAQLATSYDYYSDSSSYGSYRKIKSITQPEGGWVRYAYYDDWNRRGQVQVETRPFMDLPAKALVFSPADENSVFYDYAADFSGRSRIPSSVVRKTTNIVTGQTLTQPAINQPQDGQMCTLYQVDAYSDATNSQRSISFVVDAGNGYNNPDYYGQPFTVKRSDQSQSSFAHYTGSYDSTTKTFGSAAWAFFRDIEWKGTSDPTAGELYTSFEGLTVYALYLVPNKSTKEVTIRNPAGNVVRTETHVYTGSGNFALVMSADYTYDVAGRLLSRVASDGTSSTNVYVGGRLADSVDIAGTETWFTYDALGRVLTQTKKGVPTSGSYVAQGDLTTTATYDGAGHVTQTQTTGGTLTLTATSNYDLAGRPTSSTAPGGYTTSYAYSADHRFVTVTQPGGATTITEKYSDGQVRQIVGTAQVPAFFSYGAEAGTGRMISQQNVNGSTTRWINTYADWLGRKVQESTPDINGNFVSHLWHYNNVGHLDRSSEPGMADTLYLYDSLGSLIRSGLYIDGAGGQLAPASNDRIVDHAWTFFNSGGNWWRRETASGYATAGAGTLSLLSKVETQLTGFTASGGAGFLRLSRTDSYDPDGNVTTSFTEVNPANKIATASTLTPGSATPAVKLAYNGLLQSEQSTLGTMTTYGYDALGRPVTARDPRGNLTTTAYRAGSSEVEKVYDGLASAGLAGNPAVQPTVTYHYDAAGRPDIVTDALGKNARCDYNERGQKVHEWGDNVSPVEHVYNAYAQQTELHTFRGGSGWTGAAWPIAATGTVDVTTWAYQDATTGLMRTKTGAGPDASVITYDFTAAGQLHTRTGARGIVTTYTYSGSTGEVTNVTYSDGTPAVAYQYTRLGQVSTASDAIGTHSFSYNPSAPWQLASESLPAFFSPLRQPPRQLTYSYESAGTGTIWNTYSTKSVAGRLNGFGLGVAGNTSRDLLQIYTTSNLGQVAGVTSTAGSATTQDFVYAYNPVNRELVAGYTAGTNFAVSRSYEPNRDSLATIQSNWGGTTLTRFDYATNALGQRVTAKQSGTAFNDYYANQSYNSIYTNYRYNDRGELESSALYRGSPVANTTPATTDELPGHRFEYRYDSIGNRVTSGATGLAASGDDAYAANALNQYANRDNHALTVSGTAAAVANVAVKGAAAPRRLDNVWSATLANQSSAVQDSLAIYAAIPGNSGAADIVSQILSPYFAPPVAQSFHYDLDGNLTSDDVWSYTYDAENRLVGMQQAVAAIGTGRIPAASARSLVFTYDYLGRRVEKQVFGGWNTATQSYTTGVSDTKFIYEGWNLLAELDGSGANLTRSYAWGLDLTGSPTAAGGVGALLQITHYSGGVPSAVYYPTYDGNGNIASLVNATSGSLSAVYEYDPYGNYLRAEAIDTAVSDNPFRFSTKYADIETGLVYYGNRYYSAALGRFINKDPIEESGGLNLYGFCGNNGVNGWDYLGMVDEHSTYDQFLELYGGREDIAKAAYADRASLAYHHFFWSAGDAAGFTFGSGNGPEQWITLFDNHQNFQGPLDKLGSSAAQDQAAYAASTADAASHNAAPPFQGTPGTQGTPDPDALVLPKMSVTPDKLSQSDLNTITLGVAKSQAPNSTASQGQMIWDPNLKGYVRMNGNVMTSVFGEGSGRIGAEEATKSWAVFAATEGISGLLGRAFSAVRGWFSSSARAETEAGALTRQGLPTKCFPSGTKVSTPRGDVNIEDIKAGDTVYACDLQTGATQERTVTELLRNFTFHWVDVQIGAEVVRATRSHPFWVESEKQWIEAADLKKGMTVRLESGQIAVIANVSTVDLQQPESTYNLEVDVNHDYFVGHAHVLVHNGDGSYTITFASGKQYVGKGDLSRAADSAARISAQTGDRVVSTQWSPANGTADSFVQEEMRMRGSGGPGGSTYNQINSPGNNIAGANGCP